MLTYNYTFKNQIGFYQGKVRNVYTFPNNKILLIATDRISAFDVILPKPIPFKGAILSSIAANFLNLTKDICPNWLESNPDPRASLGKACEPIKVEMVVRGYLCGHALRTYSKGIRQLCGVKLQEGMHPYQKFSNPIITPTTKADEGHDEDISREDIISSGLVGASIYNKIEDYALQLFAFGSDYAASKGLILADTKYEFGIYQGEVYLMDEIHTPDSSRYFYQEGFEELVKEGQSPKQLSKEFVREWLMDSNFMGLEGQSVPEMTREVIKMIQDRYLELFKAIMGFDFDVSICANTDEELISRIEAGL